MKKRKEIFYFKKTILPFLLGVLGVSVVKNFLITSKIKSFKDNYENKIFLDLFINGD